MATKKDTPAKRAKARRDPAIFRPPPVVHGTLRSSMKGLALLTKGRTYPIDEHVEGDTPWAMGMDQAAQLTLAVRDPSASIVKILESEQHLQQDGVMMSINGILYAVTGVDHDEGLYTITFEDEVAWRAKQFSSYKQASRARTTRFGFIQSLVDEMSKKPYTKVEAFIPEQFDRQKILKPKADTSASG